MEKYQLYTQNFSWGKLIRGIFPQSEMSEIKAQTNQLFLITISDLYSENRGFSSSFPTSYRKKELSLLFSFGITTLRSQF